MIKIKTALRKLTDLERFALQIERQYTAAAIRSSGGLCPGWHGPDGHDFKPDRSARTDACDDNIPELVEQGFAVLIVVVFCLQPQEAAVPPATDVLMPGTLAKLFLDVGRQVRRFRIRQTDTLKSRMIEWHNYID